MPSRHGRKRSEPYKRLSVLLHDGATARGYAAATVERHQGHGRPVTVPLNELAISLLPPRPENGEDGIIFSLVKKSDNVAKYVRRIKEKAGIEKDFTYYSSRHSAATLAITAGAELYSVCKILGHGSIVSTQVYASVNMEKKTEAVNLTDGIFRIGDGQGHREDFSLPYVRFSVFMPSYHKKPTNFIHK